MDQISSYQNTKYEISILKERLELLLKYEEKIDKEKIQIKEMVILQEKILSQMENELKKINGIENKLYCEIVINGTKVSKAIDKIAMEEEKDVSTLWKNYYPKVKKRIEDLSLITLNDD